MNNYCLPLDTVIMLNRDLIKTEFNVIDEPKLEGALAAPHRPWDGKYLHTSPLERAAMLLERIANAHAFIDGNKRTAWVCGVVYLEQHNYHLEHIDDEDVADFMVDVTENRMTIKEIGIWLAEHLA